MFRPIVSRDQLVTNIHRYNDLASALTQQMPYNRGWYGVQSKRGYLFGPSKFVGYQDLTPKKYNELARTDLDGRVTEAVVRRWVEPILEGHPAFGELMNSLSEFCARHGKKLNALARVSMVKDESTKSEAAMPDELVGLLTAVYHRLSPAQKTAFRTCLE